MAAILRPMPADAALDALLEPLRRDPERSAVLLDVDGVLAPIVAQPDDAHMPETTRRPRIQIARRYGTVACVSGRRASDARRIVSLGSIAYLGNHGSEALRPGAIAPELDRELQAWTRRIQGLHARRIRRGAPALARAARGQGGDTRRCTGAACPTRRTPRPRSARWPSAPRPPATGRTGAARCSRSGRRCGSTRGPASSGRCATPTSRPPSTWATTGRTSTPSTGSTSWSRWAGWALRCGSACARTRARRSSRRRWTR